MREARAGGEKWEAKRQSAVARDAGAHVGSKRVEFKNSFFFMLFKNGH